MYDTKREYKTDEALLEAERDNMAVDAFAKAMKHKLALARTKGRSGWNNKDTCSDERLVYLFFKHLKKINDGNFIDLANFLMFLHMRDTNPDVLNSVKDLFKVDFEAELEEVMKPKCCDGCKYLNGVICNHDRGLYCVRQFEEDYFQPKEK